MIFARKLLAELNEGSIGHLIPRPLAKASQSDMFQQRPAIIRSIHQHRHLSLPPVSSLPSSNAAMEVEDCDTNLALSIGGVRNDCKEKPPINQLQEKEEEEDYSVRKRRSKSRSEDTETANKFNVNSSYQVGGGRKKLRLNKEQMGLLEDSFTEHSTLNSNQKQELASRLNILPRQVEVWFQNRRARSKLKQIEDEFERLKKWSEKLSDENRRLKEEIEELRRRRRGSPASPLYVCLTKAAPPPLPPPPPPPSMCPSCGQRAAAALASGTDDSFSVKREKDNWNLYIMG